jgi:hypothetical protein
MEIEGLNEPANMDDFTGFENDLDTPPCNALQQRGESQQQRHQACLPKANELLRCPRRKPAAELTIALGEDTKGLLKNMETFEQSTLRGSVII